MILIAGVPAEPSLRSVIDELKRIRARTLVLDQMTISNYSLHLQLDGRQINGTLYAPSGPVNIAQLSSAYVRLMDHRFVPDYETCPSQRQRIKIEQLHELLYAWLDVAPGRILNRRTAVATNGSKPYQSQLISSAGFLVPPTIVTNEPAIVRDFRAQHGRIVYKSISSSRSIVRELTKPDLDRLDLIRHCPTQFQRYLGGPDIRVHVIGASSFATLILSEAVDYRYAMRTLGREARFESYRLNLDVQRKCVRLCRLLRLDLAGIDLKLDDDGAIYCLEVNPNPAFTFYSARTEQPIARAIALHLAGRN